MKIVHLRFAKQFWLILRGVKFFLQKNFRSRHLKNLLALLTLKTFRYLQLYPFSVSAKDIFLFWLLLICPILP